MTELNLPHIPDGATRAAGQLHVLTSRVDDLGIGLRAAAHGDKYEDRLCDLAETRTPINAAADTVVVGVRASADATRAWDAFRNSSPSRAEVDAAQAVLDSLPPVPAGATDAAAAKAAAARESAEKKLADLVARREAAIKALADALIVARGKLAAHNPGRIFADGGRPRVDGTPVPTPPRGPQQLPGPPTPGPGLNPRTAPPAAPPPTTISSTGPSTDALAQVLAQAAKPQVQAPQMPMQQQPAPPMMQMPQVPQQSQPAAAPTASRDRKRDDALDLDDLLSEGDRDAPGLAAAAVPAPRPAPAGSIAPPAPTVPPVSGTSADGLRTDGPTSGRPGAVPAGAFAAPATLLSGSHIASQQMAGATPGTAPGTHPAGHPMGAPMGMPGGAGAGGGSGSRPPVLKHQGLDHGQSTLDESTPYTIARKPRD